MKKADVLAKVVGEVLSQHPRWAQLFWDRKHRHYVLGRQITGANLVYLDFSAMGSRDVISQGVGWSPNQVNLLDSLNRREAAPLRARDGSLARLRKLEHPRDFDHDEMRIETSCLCRPFGGFDLSTAPQREIEASILQEIDDYAVPYLCMMLKARFNIGATPRDIWGEPDGELGEDVLRGN